MEYSGGRTGMIRALAAAQVLAWLITAALLLAMAFVMWKFQPDMGKMQLGIYGIYVLSCLFAGRYTGKRGAHRKFLWVFWDSGRSICAFKAYGTARCAAPGTCICILYGWRDARRYDGIKCFLFPENCAIVWDDKRVFAISGNYPICFCGQRVET